MRTNHAVLKKAVVATTITGTVLAVPTLASAHFGDEMLTKGMKSDHVKRVQKLLKKEGYYQLKPTGFFGATTEKAVKAFQKENELLVDGIVGPKTKHELNDEIEFFNELLTQGDEGKHVKMVQEHLKELDYYTGDIDGIYGPRTRLAVLRFQKENGLKIDGIVGPKTFSAMHDSPEPKNASSPAKSSRASSESSTSRVKSASTTSRTATANAVKELYVESTAYTAYCAGCSGITATGINLRANPEANVVAVDPDVIPLGSKLYIEGYGYAIAGDTGGAINGRRIDVFIPSREEALEWGRRTVKVKVLEVPN